MVRLEPVYEEPRGRGLLWVWLVVGLAVVFLLYTRACGFAAEAPKIGRLSLPTHWWEYVQQAAREDGIDPYLIAAVMAIESRYDRFAVNRRCQSYGLMQLQKDVYRGMGIVDPFNAEMNIRGGSRILARLMRRYNGNIRKVLKRYNPEDTGAYSREVMKAYRQAKNHG